MPAIKFNAKRFTQDLLCDIAGGLLFNIGIYNFAVNARFATVGVSGLALILRHLWAVPMGVSILLINIPIVFVSYRYLGKSFLLRSLKSMAVFSLILDYGVPLFPAYNGNPLYAAACTGIFTGLGLTLVYLRNGSTGGSDFLVMAIRKCRPHLSIGQIALVIDAVVILTGGLVFCNLDAVILGMVSSIVASQVIDKIMYGLGAGKLVFIVTSKEEQVALKIEEATGRGCTFLKGQGAYSLDEKKIILCACNNSQAVRVRTVVHETDKNAFLIITNSSEVYGEGFQSHGGQF